MKVVVTVSKTFFSAHYKAGKPTYFEQKILAEQIGKAGITIIEEGEEKIIEGRKKHTCRSNYEYWKRKITKLQATGGVLSVRQWSAAPYRSSQETITDIHAETVGIQKLELCRMNEWTALVDDHHIPIETLATNDGLTLEEFKAWFAPVFDKAKTNTLKFAIIHFTKERYFKEERN